MRKARFLRKAKYVCVRPLRIQGVRVEPGTEIDITSTVRLRRWYKRNRIGQVGDPWTDMMISTWKEGGPTRRDNIRRVPAQKAVNQPLADLMASQAKRAEQSDKPVNQALMDLMTSQDAKNGTMLHTGGGWFNVYLNNSVTRIKGKEAAQELLDSGV